MHTPGAERPAGALRRDARAPAPGLAAPFTAEPLVRRRDHRGEDALHGSLPSAIPVETAPATDASAASDEAAVPGRRTLLVAAAIGVVLTLAGCALALVSPTASGPEGAAALPPVELVTAPDPRPATCAPNTGTERASTTRTDDACRPSPASEPDAAKPDGSTNPASPSQRPAGTPGPGDPAAPSPDPADPTAPAPEPAPTPTPIPAPNPVPAPDPVADPPAPVITAAPLAFTGLRANHAINLLGLRVLSSYTLSLSGEPGSTAGVWYGGSRAGSVSFDGGGAASITLGGGLLDLGLGNPTIRAVYTDGTVGDEIAQPRDSI